MLFKYKNAKLLYFSYIKKNPKEEIPKGRYLKDHDH